MKLRPNDRLLNHPRIIAVLVLPGALLFAGGAFAGGRVMEDDHDSTTTLAVVEREMNNMGEENPVLGALINILFTPFMKVDGQEITVFKLLVAALLLIAGLMVARRLSDSLQSKLVRKFPFNEAVSETLSRLLHIALVVFVCLFAMDFAGIPLKLFAFLGGAIAIAVGFGGQELLANFIGGLILVFERPIRKGDLILFEEQQGIVAEIGARCTRLHMPGRSDMIVPNRKLLENVLINFTLTDPFVRTDFSVGVAYGSPVRTVEKILIQAVSEHPEVLKDEMKPIVLFDDFGDNSLMFRVLCVVKVSNFLDQRRIQSDIRYRIDELFRENNIEISFPQRDVHLNTIKPLEIKLIEKNHTPETKT